MAWFKVDDKLHSHRKARALRRSHESKARDAAPFGLWVLAGSWASDSGTQGFIPTEVLSDWDDHAPILAARLVAAGLWWETEQDGEVGYGFHDWADYVPHPNGVQDPSDSGRRGNHVRWHQTPGKVSPDCELCAQDRGDIGAMDRPDDRGDGGRSSGANREPVPVPTRPDPTLAPDPAPQIALAVVADEEITTGTLVAEWIDHCEGRPPSRVIGQVSRELKSLLDEGIDPGRVRHALAEWNRKGLHPSALASVVHELANRKPQQRRGDIDWDAAFARASAKTEGMIEP